jgi:hypothetical protein
MKDMKKADWVVVRLLVDAALTGVSQGGFRPTFEHIKAIMYLNKKYGMKVLGKSIDLIREERGAK